jgi:hypothetical protein
MVAWCSVRTLGPLLSPSCRARQFTPFWRATCRPGRLWEPVASGREFRYSPEFRRFVGQLEFQDIGPMQDVLAFPLPNVQCDATALMDGVAGWLNGEWKVGIHDLFGWFVSIWVN